MTSDLKKYIDSLLIQLYRMSDGSLVLAEESHRDNVDGYVVLRRPLQLTYDMVNEETIKYYFVQWIPGSDDHVRVRLDTILAEMDASFDQKYAYSKYYLITHLQKYLSPEEMSEALSEDAVSEAQKVDSKIKTPEDLMYALKKGKRFNLN